MSFSPIEEIKVGLDITDETLPVGRLASREGVIYFEYDSSFIERGLEISPLNLKLESGVKSFDRYLFEGLPGVFNDRADYHAARSAESIKTRLVLSSTKPIKHKLD